MEEKTAHLSRLPFWGDLNGSERDYAAQNASVRKFERGCVILGDGEACLGMAYVISGRIRAFLLSPEGREITLFRLNAGDVCVLSASCVIRQINFDTQLTVESDCELCVIDSGAFGRLTAENVYARCFMYELAAERFSSVMWTMQQILFFRFDQRLAAFLIGEYDRTGSRELHMTHEQIAGMVNSAREVVARMLKRFAADGLVDLKRGVIVLQNPDTLRKLTQSSE